MSEQKDNAELVLTTRQGHPIADSQRYRVGLDYLQLPINRPKVHNLVDALQPCPPTSSSA